MFRKIFLSYMSCSMKYSMKYTCANVGYRVEFTTHFQFPACTVVACGFLTVELYRVGRCELTITLLA